MGLARAVIIISGLAALAAIALSVGLGGGPDALIAIGVVLAGLAMVALARVARFVLSEGRPRR
jgi:membrane protein implicated in regulation of membrane protease activity